MPPLRGSHLQLPHMCDFAFATAATAWPTPSNFCQRTSHTFATAAAPLPARAHVQSPPALHFCFTGAHTLEVVDRLLDDLTEAVKVWVCVCGGGGLKGAGAHTLEVVGRLPSRSLVEVTPRVASPLPHPLAPSTPENPSEFAGADATAAARGCVAARAARTVLRGAGHSRGHSPRGRSLPAGPVTPASAAAQRLAQVGV
eukprot:364230-Chlamydomonas_euryale.AAC.5